MWQSVQFSIETATDRQSVEINTELVCLTSYTNLVLRIWRGESFHLSSSHASKVEVKVEPRTSTSAYLSLNIADMAES